MQGAARFSISNPAQQTRIAWLACAALAVLAAPAARASIPQYGSGRAAGFAHAERLREALEGRPERERTRWQYERVLDAYRAIYHGDPASPKADASIAAVANLLAEEGRVFQDPKALRDAIGQYEFLRREYPASRFRASALLTEGEIYQRDFGDLAQAKAIYLNFLRLYPLNPLAIEARSELRSIRRDQWAMRRGREPRRGDASTAEAGTRAEGRRNNVLTAAVGSQEAEPHWKSSQSPVEPMRPIDNRAAVNRSAAPRTARQSADRAYAQPASPSSRLQESDIPPLLPPSAEPPPSSIAASGARSEPATEVPAETDWNAPPPPRRSTLPLITGIRHWSTPVYTRVAIDLQQEVRYTAARVPGPDRIFFDLYGTRLSPELVGRSVEVTDDGFLSRIRVAQFGGNVVRIVLDVNSLSDYSAFFLSNPSRLIIDVHGRRGGPPPMQVARNASAPAEIGIGPVEAQPPPENAPAVNPAPSRGSAASRATTWHSAPRAANHDVFQDAAPDTDRQPDSESALADVATLSRQPNEVRATRRPTTAPIVASVAGTTPAAQPSLESPRAALRRSGSGSGLGSGRIAKPSAARLADDVPPADAGAPGIPAAAEPLPAGVHAPSSMMRALGLKINRIVIDAGHGGHDSGTLGPGGLEEKDVVLDVALRLGKLLRERLGADVIYTRSDDTFIPLETRTAIANQAQADLFISIHANSSPDTSTRGVEVYYLNFTSSADALEVAARENASSDESIHQLSDLVKKIALQAKINESREFAADVDQSLYEGLEQGNPGLKDRGVKKAPFVVLIGANMPSILAEISFLTNPEDAQELREPRYRERIAEALYRGVARYVSSMNGLRLAQAGTRPASSE